MEPIPKSQREAIQRFRNLLESWGNDTSHLSDYDMIEKAEKIAAIVRRTFLESQQLKNLMLEKQLKTFIGGGATHHDNHYA